MFMDPTQFGKKYVEEMEKLFVGRVNDMLKTPDVLEKVGKGMEAGLDGKKVFDDSMRAYLERSNIPTRDDIARVLQYLQKIESKILDLEEKD